MRPSELEGLNVPALRELFLSLFGHHTASNNGSWLRRKLCEPPDAVAGAGRSGKVRGRDAAARIWTQQQQERQQQAAVAGGSVSAAAAAAAAALAPVPKVRRRASAKAAAAAKAPSAAFSAADAAAAASDGAEDDDLELLPRPAVKKPRSARGSASAAAAAARAAFAAAAASTAASLAADVAAVDLSAAAAAGAAGGATGGGFFSFDDISLVGLPTAFGARGVSGGGGGGFPSLAAQTPSARARSAPPTRGETGGPRPLRLTFEGRDGRAPTSSGAEKPEVEGAAAPAAAPAPAPAPAPPLPSSFAQEEERPSCCCPLRLGRRLLTKADARARGKKLAGASVEVLLDGATGALPSSSPSQPPSSLRWLRARIVRLTPKALRVSFDGEDGARSEDGSGSRIAALDTAAVVEDGLVSLGWLPGTDGAAGKAAAAATAAVAATAEAQRASAAAFATPAAAFLFPLATAKKSRSGCASRGPSAKSTGSSSSRLRTRHSSSSRRRPSGATFSRGRRRGPTTTSTASSASTSTSSTSTCSTACWERPPLLLRLLPLRKRWRPRCC